MAKTSVNDNLVVNIEDTNILAIAEGVKTLHTQMADVENLYSAEKTNLTDKVKEKWDTDSGQTHFFPKNYKAAATSGMVQIEAKVISAKGAMEVSVVPTLDELFGDGVDKLFEKVKTVKEVLDKRAVLKAIISNPAINMNDIEVVIKNPDILAVIEKDSDGALTTKEVVVPKSGLLDTLAEFPETVRKSSYDFIKKYLDQCLRFDVVCGNRGKKT